MKTARNVCASLFALALLALGCGRNANHLATAPDQDGALAGVSSNLVTLPFDPANFANPAANPMFPLAPGMTYTYRGISKDGEERNVVEITHRTKTIAGVTTIVVHDQVFLEDGSLAEDTFDWYAADKDGNVWYFGEDTKEYDHGTLVTTAGSWEAGKNGARPGIIMLAHPQVGDQYKQEDSPGIVEDMARVVSRDETLTVPAGTYEHCLKTREWTPIEPGNRSYKFYAPGVGLVLEIATRNGGERVELTHVD